MTSQLSSFGLPMMRVVYPRPRARGSTPSKLDAPTKPATSEEKEREEEEENLSEAKEPHVDIAGSVLKWRAVDIQSLCKTCRAEGIDLGSEEWRRIELARPESSRQNSVKQTIYLSPSKGLVLSVCSLLLPPHLQGDYVNADSLEKWANAFAKKTIVVFLCHGGRFAGAVFKDGKPIVHKTFHRYVCRGHGFRQGTKDKRTGNEGGRSTGKFMRRYNEEKHAEELNEIMGKWSSHIREASLILLHAPGANRRYFVRTKAEERSLDPKTVNLISADDSRVHNVPISLRRPILEEAKNAYRAIVTCTLKWYPVSCPSEKIIEEEIASQLEDASDQLLDEDYADAVDDIGRDEEGSFVSEEGASDDSDDSVAELCYNDVIVTNLDVCI